MANHISSEKEPTIRRGVLKSTFLQFFLLLKNCPFRQIETVFFFLCVAQVSDFTRKHWESLRNEKWHCCRNTTNIDEKFMKCHLWPRRMFHLSSWAGSYSPQWHTVWHHLIDVTNRWEWLFDEKETLPALPRAAFIYSRSAAGLDSRGN